MNGLDCYRWFAGSMSDFAKPFKESEALYNQARVFWRHLEGASTIIIAVFVIIGVAFAFTYYIPYNEKPGRHYHPIHWLKFLLYTFVLTFIITLGFEYFVVKPKLDGAFMVEFMIAIANAIYASLVYWAVSFLWCNFCPTNAYRMFKI